MTALLLMLMPVLQTSVGDPNHFNNFLVLGYTVMGLIVLGYVITLFVRQRNLQKDLQLMNQLLQEDEED